MNLIPHSTAVCAIAWGSVADWISGIGSLAAVTAALWIAVDDRRRLRRTEEANRTAHFARQQSALDGALTLTRRLREATSGAGRDSMPALSWRDTANVCREVLEQIQRSPDLEPPVRIALQNFAWILSNDSMFRADETGSMFNKTLGEKFDDLAEAEEDLRRARTVFEAPAER